MTALATQLRRLALLRQGLVGKRPFGQGLSGTLRAVEHLGYVQIDTLSVVERAHHHVLWSRVPGYDPGHLNRLVRKQEVFEYWYHAASYLPMRDYRFALPKMEAIRSGDHPYFSEVDTGLMKEILARTRGEGVLRVRDVDTGNKGPGSWWNWGPGRKALDKLFMQGDLMVSERNGMEKVYRLREHCLPEGLDLRMPSMDEYAAYLFDTTLRAHGVFIWKQLVHLKRGHAIREAMRQILEERVSAGIVAQIDAGDRSSVYVDVQALDNLPKVGRSVRILSPFDNAVMHRDRLNALFGFDFRIECYVPAPKRVFGYFCLPILFGDRFVGRIDCKAHRAQQQLEVLSLHLEDIRFDRDRFFAELNAELHRFATFNRCTELDHRAVSFPASAQASPV